MLICEDDRSSCDLTDTQGLTTNPVAFIDLYVKTILKASLEAPSSIRN